MEEIEYYRMQNKEQRQEIDGLKSTIYRLQNADIEKTKSLIEVFEGIDQLTRINDIYKITKIQNIAERTLRELKQDVDDMMFIPNDEEGKIIELPSYQLNNSKK